MPFDANLVLRDGTVDLVTGEAAPTSLSFVLGAKCVDLGGTVRPRGEAEGVMNMVCALVIPAAPTVTYNDSLYVQICESDNLTFGYNTIAIMGYYWTFTRMLNITITTAFAAGDLAGALTGQTTNDAGILRYIHPDALTAGNVCKVIVSMVDENDTYADVDEVLHATTGRAAMTGAGFVEAKPRLSGPNTFFRTISPTKKYIQATLTVAGASNWGGVELMMTPYPFRKL